MVSRSVRVSLLCCLWLIVCAMALPAETGLGSSPAAARVWSDATQIMWLPQGNFEAFVLRISAPDGRIMERTFTNGNCPYIDLGEEDAALFNDGLYRYELLSLLSVSGQRQRGNEPALNPLQSDEPTGNAVLMAGTFSIVKGGFVDSSETEIPLNQPLDVIHADDVIIQMSLCVGFDCVNGENFGFDTIKLKENNLRIYFEDTSNSSSFPTNDWRIIVNDSTNGGSNYFAIEDSTAGRIPFQIDAGALANSFRIAGSGRIGLGTSVPAVKLHLRHNDTPTVRLDQDNSSGWAPYTWDVAGNEANFFIRDVTAGSRLSFRIQPGTPTNTLTLRADGKVGLGTWAPEANLEVETTGSNPMLLLDRTDGTKAFMTAKQGAVAMGTLSEAPLVLSINGEKNLMLTPEGALGLSNGANCTAAGVWVDASRREYKTDIRSLTAGEAEMTLASLEPVQYTPKSEPEERYLGFIAEDVPELVADGERRGVSPMDIVAVLTRVVQEQQKTIADLQRRLAELEKQNPPPAK